MGAGFLRGERCTALPDGQRSYLKVMLIGASRAIWDVSNERYPQDIRRDSDIQRYAMGDRQTAIRKSGPGLALFRPGSQ